MAPKEADNVDAVDVKHKRNTNQDLMPDAGKVHLGTFLL